MINPIIKGGTHRAARHGAPTPGSRSLGSSELHCGVGSGIPASLLLITVVHARRLSFKGPHTRHVVSSSATGKNDHRVKTASN